MPERDRSEPFGYLATRGRATEIARTRVLESRRKKRQGSLRKISGARVAALWLPGLRPFLARTTRPGPGTLPMYPYRCSPGYKTSEEPSLRPESISCDSVALRQKTPPNAKMKTILVVYSCQALIFISYRRISSTGTTSALERGGENFAATGRARDVSARQVDSRCREYEQPASELRASAPLVFVTAITDVMSNRG